jgi:hypothetical protein
LQITSTKTDSTGSTRVYIEPDTTYYKILIEYGGSVVYETDWDVIYKTSYTFTTDVEGIYVEWPGLEGQLAVDNSSTPVFFQVTYNDRHADIANVCLVTYSGVTSLSLYNSTCLDTLSGTIIHKIGSTGTYTAFFYYVMDDGTVVPLDQAEYVTPGAVPAGMKEEGLLLSILLVIGLFFGPYYITKSPVMAIIGLDVAVLAIWWWQLFPITTWALGIIIPGSFYAMHVANKVST